MAYIWMLLCVVLVALCAMGIAYLAEWADKRADEREENCLRQEDEMSAREREKHAFYMSNFWNYDGTEQQEWDEDSGVYR